MILSACNFTASAIPAGRTTRSWKISDQKMKFEVKARDVPFSVIANILVQE